MVAFVLAKRRLCALNGLKCTYMSRVQRQPAASLLKSPQWSQFYWLITPSLWNEFVPGGTQWHSEALHCLFRFGLIKENKPGDIGKRCLIKNQHCANAIRIAWEPWNSWMTGPLCCNLVGKNVQLRSKYGHNRSDIHPLIHLGTQSHAAISTHIVLSGGDNIMKQSALVEISCCSPSFSKVSAIICQISFYRDTCGYNHFCSAGYLSTTCDVDMKCCIICPITL